MSNPLISNMSFRTLTLAFAAAAMVLVASSPADAGRKHRRAAAIAGVAGLAAGIIVGGALAQNRYYHSPGYYYVERPRVRYNTVRRYRAPSVIYYDEPVTVYRVKRRKVRHYRPEPWTDAWYDYCDARYRSFNPRTGTFRGYDGRNHFCR